MAKDRCFTLTDLYHKIATWYPYIKVGRTSINILWNELGMCKVSARWVPHQLIEEQRAQRTGAGLEFLMRYLNEVMKEICIWIKSSLKTKHGSIFGHQRRRKNWKFGKRWMNQLQRSLKKYHLSVKLWLRSFRTKRVLLSSTICLMRLITRHWYHNTLVKLQMAIKVKRPGMLTKGVVFLHDNAHPP